MQVSGLKYTIDAEVPSNVVTDENGMFVKVDGDYRVKDVMIYNKDSKQYEPIDSNKDYFLGGENYILRNAGNGLNMFVDDELVVDYVGQDYVILSEYIKSFSKDDSGIGDVCSKNSPLNDYEGFGIDYENPFGAGRINIVNLPER